MLRVLDILIAFCCLIVLFPLMIIISLILIISNGNNVIFIQKRVGQNNVIFSIYKFKTMSERDNDQEPIFSESRILNCGKFLRRTHLDELPQLFCILIGTMSFVGPRPHMIEEDRLFEEMNENYFVRKSVRPGMTGLAQIKGYVGPITNKQQLSNRINADKEWISNKSINLYLKILFLTFFNLIKGLINGHSYN